MLIKGQSRKQEKKKNDFEDCKVFIFLLKKKSGDVRLLIRRDRVSAVCDERLNMWSVLIFFF
jgi:hypothetical protein